MDASCSEVLESKTAPGAAIVLPETVNVCRVASAGQPHALTHLFLFQKRLRALRLKKSLQFF